MALRRIMIYAYRHSVFYRRLFDGQGVRPTNLWSLFNISHFPVVQKLNFLDSPEEEYVIDAGQRVEQRSTSGTSGQPFSFYSINDNKTPYASFLCYRFLHWLGFSSEAIRKSVSIIRMSPNIEKRKEYRFRIGLPLSQALAEPKSIFEEIVRVRPLVVEAYPSVLVELAKALAENSDLREKVRFKYAISSGETIEPQQRKYIEDSFGCEVFDRYGLEEFWVVGVECWYHSGFHINLESFFVEIIDENGVSVPVGEKGRIIITDFRNRTMPFVRYDTGDYGCFLKMPCPCGLSGRRLMVEGRLGEYLFVNDRKIYHFEFGKMMERFSGFVLQYQVVRIDDKKIKFFLVVGPMMKDDILKIIRKDTEALLGEGCRLDIETVSHIARTPRGKRRILINR